LFTVREEHRLTVFENRELRRIFGSKGDETVGKWEKLHNASLPALFAKYKYNDQDM
jgi:hypothetical protein